MKLTYLAYGALAAATVGLLPTTASAESPWMVRGRVIAVLPDPDATVSPIGGDMTITDDVVPELDISYFFAKHWAAELILATAFHEVTHTPTGTDLGGVWLLPPTLTVQYHLDPDSDSARPYVGVGVNYTIFYNVDDPAGQNVSYDNNFGWALQAGVDFPVNEHWSLNFDVKKIFLDTDATVVPLGVTADVDIDPWVIGFGVGYRY